MYKSLFALLSLNILFILNLFGQDQAVTNPLEHITANFQSLGLASADVNEMKIVDEVLTRHNGARHFYIQQYFEGIPVYNALMNVTQTKEGRFLITGNRFIKNLDKINIREKQTLTSRDAVLKSVEYMTSTVARNPASLQLSENKAEGLWIYNMPDIATGEIPVRMMLYPEKEGLTLGWSVEINPIDKPDHWQYGIHAGTGELINVVNYTTYCSFDHNSFTHQSDLNSSHFCNKADHQHITNQGVSGNSSYLVFPFPAESPSHSGQDFAQGPLDLIASPFGWHDTDGIEGPEYTITRGNNVHAYLDRLANNSASDPEPDGGAELQFHFPYNGDFEPDSMKEAATVNLFYVNNMMHDLAYRLGFDETSGNFQANNYNRGGQANDYVKAEAFDGGGENNANFSTPRDGNNGRMQMYLWTRSNQLRLEIEEPALIAGLYEAGKAGFGQNMDINRLTGDVVLALDNTAFPDLGCQQLTGSVSGKIALINRGVCEFGRKVLNAQTAGAIGALVCNVPGIDGGNGEELLEMAAGAVGGGVNIPSLFLKKSTCDLIRTAILNGENVRLIMGLKTFEGPAKRESSFDNGVIAHEFTHGITTRLTGGPDNSSCLSNPDINGDGNPDGEQMGEGWSDFYALAFTTREGDLGTDVRGIGTYVTGQQVNGKGIRNYPYSTDMSINPITYDFIRGRNVPHGVGEVWAVTLWDLYWKFIDLYGFDPSWESTTSGNFKALLLITDALKMQPCNPGFLDGRDAVLLADEINFGGEHQCLLWEVFARRGMGFFAEQGDPYNHNDGRENFDVLPTCIRELKLYHESEFVVEPGSTFDVTLKAVNHKEDAVSNVKIRETLPTGLTFVPNSSNTPVSVNGDLLEFDLGSIAPLEEKTVIFKLKSDPDIFSNSVYKDEMEVDNGDWVGINSVGSETYWELVDFFPQSKLYSWYAPESFVESDMSLYMFTDPILIDGDNPAFSFYHAFDTEELQDGGFVEYSVDGGTNWLQFRDEHLILNGYNGNLSYSTIPLPGLKAFSGSSDGYIKSYIDLNFLKGSEVSFSFRFATDASVVADAGYPGWFIDDVEVINMKKYTRQVCLSSDETEDICLVNDALIGTKTGTATKEATINQLDFSLVPNPANTHLTILIKSFASENALIRIINQDGKIHHNQHISLHEGDQSIHLSGIDIPSGMYYLQLISGNTQRMTPLLIQK
ncbi:MAG TPA: hypothetical protein DCX89_04275 [Saprospirales bacterium]|nr:hypothetical protein [Saprospirales bacterium]HRQ29914.1 M36 family metallopeptidase [Saprospiraceae bacterium]